VAISRFENEDGDNILLDTLHDTEPLPFEQLALAEDKKHTEKLLEKLSPLYREVLILRYYHEFTFEEIGRVLEKPLDTVKSQHRRALILLRKLLNAPKQPF
jgi:RNA polymerase sigma-70 factor (ECF subfamily)